MRAIGVMALLVLTMGFGWSELCWAKKGGSGHGGRSGTLELRLSDDDSDGRGRGRGRGRGGDDVHEHRGHHHGDDDDQHHGRRHGGEDDSGHHDRHGRDGLEDLGRHGRGEIEIEIHRSGGHR